LPIINWVNINNNCQILNKSGINKMKKFNIDTKVALVTGANRGIGEAFVRHLLKSGAIKIYAGVRDIENLKSLVEEFPEQIEPVLLDVTNTDHISSLKEKIGKLDILVNNAGVAHGCFFTSDDATSIAKTEMETNYFGPVQVTNAVLPLLKQSSEAAIINISSIAGIGAMAAIGPYSASKAAMHSYTQGLRAELQNENIAVIGVYPGPIDTRMAEAWEMDKPAPSQVANKTFDVLTAGEFDVFPDDFSQQMHALFLDHPHKLQEAFSQMQ